MPDRTVHVVDDDADFRASLVRLLAVLGYDVRDYDSGRAFAAAAPRLTGGCALIDVCMPDLDGLALQRELAAQRVAVPVVIMTGHGDVPMAVRAMKEGAVDFLEKPFTLAALQAGIDAAFQRRPILPSLEREAAVDVFLDRLETLTAREREVLEGIVAGHSTKIIAFQLGIGVRTVDVHRARITEKLQVRGLSNLVRMALAAGVVPTP